MAGNIGINPGKYPRFIEPTLKNYNHPFRPESSYDHLGRFKSQMKINDFASRHPGQRAFIIGKGPSLDTVEVIRDQLATGVIFCLNESIHQVEKLDLPQVYVVQQDSELEFRCTPKTAIHFMNSWQHQPGIRNRKSHVTVSPWDPNAVLYRPDFFKETEGTLSAIIALKIAAYMGIKKVTLCCFDAMKDCFQGPMTYAKCIGIQREGSHRSHNAVILIEARQLMDEIKIIHPHVAKLEK